LKEKQGKRKFPTMIKSVVKNILNTINQNKILVNVNNKTLYQH